MPDNKQLNENALIALFGPNVAYDTEFEKAATRGWAGFFAEKGDLIKYVVDYLGLSEWKELFDYLNDKKDVTLPDLGAGYQNKLSFPILKLLYSQVSPKIFFSQDNAASTASPENGLFADETSFNQIRDALQNQWLVKTINKLDGVYRSLEKDLKNLEPNSSQLTQNRSSQRWNIFYKHLLEVCLSLEGKLNQMGVNTLIEEITKSLKTAQPTETPKSFLKILHEGIQPQEGEQGLFRDPVVGLKTFITGSLKTIGLDPVEEIIPESNQHDPTREETGDYYYPKLVAWLFPDPSSSTSGQKPSLVDMLLINRYDPENPDSPAILTESGQIKLIQLWHEKIIQTGRYTEAQNEALKANSIQTANQFRDYYNGSSRTELLTIITGNHLLMVFIFEQWLHRLKAAYTPPEHLAVNWTQITQSLSGMDNLGNETYNKLRVKIRALEQAISSAEEADPSIADHLEAVTKELIEVLIQSVVEDLNASGTTSRIFDHFKAPTKSFKEILEALGYSHALTSEPAEAHSPNHSLQLNLAHLNVDNFFNLISDLTDPIEGDHTSSLIMQFFAPSRFQLLLQQLTEESSIFDADLRQNMLSKINQAFISSEESPSENLNALLKALIQSIHEIPSATTANQFDLCCEILQQPWISILAIQQSARLFGEIPGSDEEIRAFKSDLSALANTHCNRILEGDPINDVWLDYLRNLTRSFEGRPHISEYAKKYIQLIKADEDISSIAFFNKLSGFYLCLAQSKDSAINETLVWMRLVHAFTLTILECDHGIKYHNQVIGNQLNALFYGIIATLLVIAATVLYIYQSWMIFYLMLGSMALTAGIGYFWYHFIENKGLGKIYSLGAILAEQVKFLKGLGSSDNLSQLTKACVTWYENLLDWLSQYVEYITAKLPLIISSTLMGVALGIAISIPIWAMMLQPALDPLWFIPSLAITCIALFCYQWGATPVDSSVDDLIKTNRETDMSIATMFKAPSTRSSPSMSLAT